MRKYFSNSLFATTYIIFALLIGVVGGLLVEDYMEANDKLFNIEERSIQNEKEQESSIETLGKTKEDEQKIKEMLIKIQEPPLVNEKIQESSNKKTLAKAKEVEQLLIVLEKKNQELSREEWDIKEDRLLVQIEREDVVEQIYLLTPIALVIALLSMALPYGMIKNSSNNSKEVVVVQSSANKMPPKKNSILKRNRIRNSRGR